MSQILLVSHENEIEEGVEYRHKQVDDAEVDQQIVGRVPHFSVT